MKKLKKMKSDIKFIERLESYIAYLEQHYEDKQLRKKLASFERSLLAMEARSYLVHDRYTEALRSLQLVNADTNVFDVLDALNAVLNFVSLFVELTDEMENNDTPEEFSKN